MQKLTEKLIEKGLSDRVFTIHDLKSIVNGTDASVYGLVNKAIAKNEIIRLKKGVYVLNQKYNPGKISTFYIASQIEAHSYISLESALSFHGWIPEKVTVVSSIINHGRKMVFNTPFGEFEYYHLPTRAYGFLLGVQRETTDQKPFLIASAPRALLDLVYQRKIEWQGLNFLVNSLRIEYEQLASINKDDYKLLAQVYKSARVLKFLRCLIKELYGSHNTIR